MYNKHLPIEIDDDFEHAPSDSVEVESIVALSLENEEHNSETEYEEEDEGSYYADSRLTENFLYFVNSIKNNDIMDTRLDCESLATDRANADSESSHVLHNLNLDHYHRSTNCESCNKFGDYETNLANNYETNLANNYETNLETNYEYNYANNYASSYFNHADDNNIKSDINKDFGDTHNNVNNLGYNCCPLSLISEMSDGVIHQIDRTSHFTNQTMGVISYCSCGCIYNNRNKILEDIEDNIPPFIYDSLDSTYFKNDDNFDGEDNKNK